MQVCLLGQFQVVESGALITGLNHVRLQELLAYLLLQHGKPTSRQHIACLFWPDSPEEQARTNLRNLLHRLRKALPASDRYLIVDETMVQWNCEPACCLDVTEFENAIHKAEAAQKTERVLILAQAAGLYTGELLPECYSDWLLAERERLRLAYLSTLNRLAGLYEDQREYPLAIQAVQDLLRLDALNENAYAWLMRLYALQGNRGQALHIYHSCAEILRRELDVDPGPALHALYKQLLQTAALRVPAAPSTELFTRQAEWEQLTRNWAELLRDQRPLRAMLITGESGVGKTHLAHSFVLWLQRQGYHTCAAACYESGSDLAYAPLATWLAELYEQDERFINKLPAVWRMEISRLLPELRARNTKLAAPGPLTEKWQLLQFYEALLQCFASLHGPLLLFLDDIHWCDRETLAWLAWLQTRPGAEQLVLVATARCEALAGDHPALQLFKKSGQNTLLELQPLDEAQTRLLIEQLQGEPVAASLAHALFLHSEGNPLFVTEMVRAGLDQYLDGAGPLPERVQSVINWRLNRLSPSARRVLELAAVIGRSFSYELLKVASGLDEQSLVNALDECWRQRILREQGSQAYDFNHDKLRQVVYDGLSQARRRMWHTRTAQALLQIFAANPELAAGAIAHHLEAAGQPARSLPIYERAAQLASQA